jgi:hypothetical protein
MRDFDAIAERPAGHLAETGLPQLTSGLGFFILGSSVLIQRALPRTFLYMVGAQWIGIACAAAVMVALASLKRRMVFPRGGYVVPVGRMRRLVLLCITLLSAIAIWAYVGTTPGHRLDFLKSRLVWPGFAITFSVICLWAGLKQKSSLTIYFALYLACVAPLLWWLPISTYEQSACLQVAAGAPVAITGAIRLRRFLIANPMPAEPRNG